MRVYLDTCCLNRPFDPSNEERVRLEAEAVLAIIRQFTDGDWIWVGSDVLDAEILAHPNERVRAALLEQMRFIAVSVPLTDTEVLRADDLAQYGFRPMDSQHLACAESGKVDLFLTTDDGLVKAASRAGHQLHVKVANPTQWMEGIVQ